MTVSVKKRFKEDVVGIAEFDGTMLILTQSTEWMYDLKRGTWSRGKGLADAFHAACFAGGSRAAAIVGNAVSAKRAADRDWRVVFAPENTGLLCMGANAEGVVAVGGVFYTGLDPSAQIAVLARGTIDRGGWNEWRLDQIPGVLSVCVEPGGRVWAVGETPSGVGIAYVLSRGASRSPKPLPIKLESGVDVIASTSHGVLAAVGGEVASLGTDEVTTRVELPTETEESVVAMLDWEGGALAVVADYHVWIVGDSGEYEQIHQSAPGMPFFCAATDSVGSLWVGGADGSIIALAPP